MHILSMLYSISTGREPCMIPSLVRDRQCGMHEGAGTKCE